MSDGRTIPSHTDPFTLSAWIMSQQHNVAPEARGRLTILLHAITVGCKFVASAVRKAGLAGNDVLGMAGSENVQGEDQKKLDVMANEVFKNVLSRTGQCAVMVTEEEEEPIIVSEERRGEYCVVFDPLDGSSNIDCGVSIGTIFGIYKVRDGSTGAVEDVLRPGREMVAAGYCMYGSMTYLMLSTGHGVAGFTLDPSLGEFVATHRGLTVPPRGKIYSTNEGNASMWDAAMTSYVAAKKHPGAGNKPYSLRYVGSMVADVHRTLLYGGVFMYPADKKSPKGKLRLLYEGYPMAFLVEQAGGRAIDERCEPVLDRVPEHIHDRSPVYLGSKEDVDDIERCYREAGLV